MHYYNKTHDDCLYYTPIVKDSDIYGCAFYTCCSPNHKCYKYIKKEHIDLLKKLSLKYKATYDSSWLPKNPNLALLVCLGAGPWKVERRTKVQKKAIKWFLESEIKDLKYANVLEVKNVFPLHWQNQHLIYLIENLNRINLTFQEFCDIWKKNITHKWEDFSIRLFQLCNVRNYYKGTKTLWLFTRDFMNGPSFPIDRHVTKKLQEYNLPLDSHYMTRACVAAKIDGNELNRAFFSGINTNFKEIKE